MKLSIVIPCYNEEHRIGRTLRQMTAYCRRRRHTYEIIVVDDGSEDATRDVVTSIRDRNIVLTPKRANRGKGYSVRQGALLAKHSLVLFSDADLSTPIEELDKFIPHLHRADIIIGTRTDMRKIRIRQPRYREMMGRTFSVLKRLIVGLPFKDTQCGFKLFTNRARHILRNNESIILRLT